MVAEIETETFQYKERVPTIMPSSMIPLSAKALKTYFYSILATGFKNGGMALEVDWMLYTRFDSA